MIAAEDLLFALKADGVEIWVEGDNLRFRAPPEALSDERRSLLRERADDLRKLLSLVAKDTGPQLQARNESGVLPLSFAQERLWFLAQLEGPSSVYNIPTARRLHGPLDVAAWQRSLDALFTRHEALRSVFVTRDGQPEVRLLNAAAGLPLVFHDVSDAPDPQAQLAALEAEEAATPFDLARGPLIRARLIRLGEHDHVSLLTMHHIVSDGWSMGVLTRELNALYAALRDGRDASLPPLPVQYPDYAAWQRQWLAGERLKVQADYWRRTLAAVPTLLELPTDRPRPAQQEFSGAFLPVRLDAELTASLKRLADKHGATLFTVLLSAWAAVLARLSGQHDLVIGTPSANRGRREIESLIGFFVNTLALRIDLSGDPSVAELIDRAQRTAVAAQDHQDLPFEQVVEIVQPPRSLDRSPLFQVMFAWQNNERAAVDLPDLQVALHPTALHKVKFDLELELSEWSDTIGGGIGYATALFDAATIERQRGYFITLLRAMVADDRQPVMRVELLSPDERTLLLTEWNRTEAPYPEQLCVHELFEAQAARDPDAVALIYEEQTLSYGELNARANRLARHLVALGVQPDARVGLCVERSIEMVVGLLAVLKAGGAYVPLDPAYPPERLAFMLEDSAPDVVLTHAAARAALETAATGLEHPPVVLDLLADADRWAAQRDTDLDPQSLGLGSRHLAYVIYTSGSTGTPKGVMVEHHNVVNYLSWALRVYSPRAGARVPVNTPIAFDATVTSLLIPLCSAGGVWLLPPGSEELPSLGKLLAARCDCSLVKLTPAHLDGLARLHDHQQTITEHAAAALVIGGEALAAHHIRLWRHQAPGTRLINEYGPTETTVGVVTYEVDQATPLSGSIPIGHPIANTRIYLLDEHGEPVPLGAVGEIHIGGAGVARGYLNRAELTAERFLDSPFVAGDRLYKTGDLARYRSDGNLVFLGRNDQQVKIRGFRIELGEIEARLAEHPAVREAAVLAREDQPGDKRLVAYVVYAENRAEEHEAGALVADLRAHLAARLPDYMVPAAYVALDALPLTPNGKLDRAKLPPPDTSRAIGAAMAPRTETERVLKAEIFEALLKTRNIGIHDSFFELGGNSLQAFQLISRLKSRFAVEIRLAEFLHSPTIAHLGTLIDGRRTSQPVEDESLALVGSVRR